MASKFHSYRPVSSADDVSSSSSRDDRDFHDEKVYDQPRGQQHWSRLLLGLLLVSSAVVNLVFGSLFLTNFTQEPTDQACAKQLSVYCEFLPSSTLDFD
jgi:hypothetical protein